ncbi:MAG: sulfotransferase, partial [Myxococcota bacterium]
MDPKVLGQLVELSRERGELTPRYVATAGLFVSVMLAAYAVMRGFQTLDRVVTPGFETEDVEAPVFIVGNPRSGTTFLHRMMSRDEQFSSLALYETLMPSSSVIRGLSALARLDTAVGRPVQRLIGAAERFVFQGWKGIHKVSFSAPEEDEMLFMYAMRTPALMLGHPALADLPDVREPSALPPDQRAELAADVRGAYQRHVWAVGGGKRLLVKNALAAGRLEIYREAFPDLMVVHLLRHPYQAIPSMVSMFSRPW